MKIRKLKNFHKVDGLELIHSGAEYFYALEKLIDEAKEEIYICVYIFQPDETGQMICEALKNAAGRGVKVHLMVDSRGGQELSTSKVLADAIASGVEFRLFSPSLNSNGLNFGRRLHQKVAVFDNDKLLIGGINIANRYSGIKGGLEWLDFAVYVKGEIAEEARYICEKIWDKKYSKKYQISNKLSRFTERMSLVRLRQNDWFRNKNQITHATKSALRNAENYVTIAGAYFLPNGHLRSILKKAVKRGVKIRVLVPRSSDSKMFKRATDFLYDWMIRNNIEIYEYRPTMVHAKTIVVDDIWATVGSHDLNFLSTFILVEMNLEIVDKTFATNLGTELDKIITTQASRITSGRHLNKLPVEERLLNWFSFHIMSASLWILSLISSKKND